MRTLLRRIAHAERMAAEKLMDVVLDDLERNGRLIDVDFVTMEIAYRLGQLAKATEWLAGEKVGA